MSLRGLLLAVAMLGYADGVLGTEESAQRFLQSQAWAGVATPKQVRVLWETIGDLNGDGLADYVAVVDVRQGESTEEEERLVVLAGTAEGSFKLLSQSGSFCGVGRNGKFYDLHVDANSLFVEAVWVAEGEHFSGRTMQFRYNRSIGDLQLIGEEERSGGERQGYRVSVNFLTGTIVFSRTGERKRKEVKSRLIKIPLIRLQSFSCFSQDDLRPQIYIDENFRVDRH